MRHDLLLLLVGLAYALIFRVLALIRREEFSFQFVLEAVVITLVGAGASYLGLLRIDPIAFVLILYLITMRSRLLVDLANLFARSGRFQAAGQTYGWASRLMPDTPGRRIIAMNRGAALILEGRLEEAISLLEEVASSPHLSPKQAAAVHYNLGVAYRSKGDTQRSVRHLRAAIEALPGSVYARHAQAMLKKRSGKK